MLNFYYPPSTIYLNSITTVGGWKVEYEVLLIVGVKIAVVMYDEQPVFES